MGSVHVRGMGGVAHKNPLTVQVGNRVFSGSGHFEDIGLILSGSLEFLGVKMSLDTLFEQMRLFLVVEYKNWKSCEGKSEGRWNG